MDIRLSVFVAGAASIGVGMLFGVWLVHIILGIVL